MFWFAFISRIKASLVRSWLPFIRARVGSEVVMGVGGRALRHGAPGGEGGDKSEDQDRVLHGVFLSVNLGGCSG